MLTRRTRKMMEKATRRTKRRMKMSSRVEQNGQQMTTMTMMRTTSRPRSRKPTMTIDALSRRRHPADPLPGSSPLAVCISECHRWRGWRTDLKENDYKKKKINMVITSRVQQTPTAYVHTPDLPSECKVQIF